MADRGHGVLDIFQEEERGTTGYPRRGRMANGQTHQQPEDRDADADQGGVEIVVVRGTRKDRHQHCAQQDRQIRHSL